MLALQRMLSYPVWPPSVPILPLFSAFLCPSLCLSGSTGAVCQGLGAGWESDSQPGPQEVLEALLGLMPMCWQTLYARQTANMPKMLPPGRVVVALHYIM